LQPSRLAPEIPPIAQAGLSGFEVVGWNGFLAPRGTPAAILRTLNGALQRGLDDTDLRGRLAAAGYEPAAPNTPEEFGRFIQSDTARWVALVERTNITAH
jgi:tripartite-type tricarboxylate transporter receptor subunit TctC